MYLLPRPRTITEKQGSYEINYQSRIVLGETIRENGITYAGILKDGILNGTGVNLSYIRGKAVDGDICLNISEELSRRRIGFWLRRMEFPSLAETERVFCTECRHFASFFHSTAVCCPAWKLRTHRI